MKKWSLVFILFVIVFQEPVWAQDIDNNESKMAMLFRTGIWIVIVLLSVLIPKMNKK